MDDYPDMKQTRRHRFLPGLGARLAMGLLLMLAVPACSTTSSSDVTDTTPRPGGGTASADAQKEFLKAVEIFDKQGDQGLDAAIAALEKAVATDPGFGKAWFNLGLLYEKKKQPEQARKAYTRATETAVKLGDAHVNLGMMALDDGNPEEARRYFERALEAENYNAAAHNNISVFYREQKDFPNAVRHARQSLAGDASNIEAYANLARIYYRRGNFDVAKLVILNALKMPDGPNNPDLRNILALVEIARNDVTEGIRQLEKAVELDPQHVAALLNLGAVILNVRDYPRAIQLFERVLKLQPENTTAQISIAVAKRGAGDLAAADEIYQSILQKDPQNAIVQFNLGVLEHEHKAQNAVAGLEREPPETSEDESASAQMLAGAATTAWNIENLESAIKHYEAAIEHYRNFLAYDSSGVEARREEANRRIGQVATIIKATREQIPQLQATVDELRETAKIVAEQEAADRAAAAQDADSSAGGEENLQKTSSADDGA